MELIGLPCNKKAGVLLFCVCEARDVVRLTITPIKTQYSALFELSIQIRLSGWRHNAAGG